EDLAGQDEKRLQVWTNTLSETAFLLRQQWEDAGAQARAQHQEMCAALAQTSDEISTQAKAHIHATMTDIAKLVEQAGEAPKMAAGLVAEVRQSFSESMARDNAMLDERNRLLETSASLMSAMQHASSEQR